MPSTAGRPGLACEMEQVIALRFVELQGRGQRVEHALRGAGQAAALNAHVVLDRYPGE